MIGGYDRFLPGHPYPEDLAVVVRLFREAWADAIVECPDVIEPVPISSETLFPLPPIQEVFIYRDRATYSLCESEGVVPEVTGKVLWVSHDDGALCFVLDDEGTELDSLVVDAIEAVRFSHYYLERRAA